ncbi:MAG: hypothetical protein ACKOPO_14875, partial [Novosphingobium sp.]
MRATIRRALSLQQSQHGHLAQPRMPHGSPATPTSPDPQRQDHPAARALACLHMDAPPFSRWKCGGAHGEITMSMRMLIDARHQEETRVAVLKGNRIEEFDFESAEHKQIKGNIYLAKVTRV